MQKIGSVWFVAVVSTLLSLLAITRAHCFLKRKGHSRARLPSHSKHAVPYVKKWKMMK